MPSPYIMCKHSFKTDSVLTFYECVNGRTSDYSLNDCDSHCLIYVGTVIKTTIYSRKIPSTGYKQKTENDLVRYYLTLIGLVYLIGVTANMRES